MAEPSEGIIKGGDLMRCPKTNVRSDAGIDRQMGRTLLAVGLGVAVAGFGGRYAFHLWKPLRQIISEKIKKMPTLAFPAYYKGGFERPMSRREANLVLGISPTSTKAKVREAYWRLISLNHPDKGGSKYLAQKITEAKDLLYKENRR